MLRHAARARRVPVKGRMGTPHTPFFAREACRRRIPPQSLFSVPNRMCHVQRVYLSQGGRRPDPRRPLRVRRPRGLRKLVSTLGSARSTATPFPRASVEVPRLISMNSVQGTAVHTEAEDGLRVHRRASLSVLSPPTAGRQARPLALSGLRPATGEKPRLPSVRSESPCLDQGYLA